MHICDARGIRGPDGPDTVAGAATNVLGCLCYYLYHGETQEMQIFAKTDTELKSFGQ